MFSLLYLILLIPLACFLLPPAICLVLCKRLNFQFQKLGLFSVTGVVYRNEQWAITIDTIKVRFSQAESAQPARTGSASAISDAWLTFHLSGVHVRAIGKVKHSTMTTTSRSSAMALRLVTHALKWISSMPIQLVLVGLARYVAAQLDGVTLETRTHWQIQLDSLYFRSSLFTSSANGNHLCPHSLKRAEHLFWRPKVFTISVGLGPARVANEKQTLVRLSSHQQASVQCHLGTGCVTLTNIDLDLRINNVRIKLDPLLRLCKIQPSLIDVKGSTFALNSLQWTAAKRCSGAQQDHYESHLAFHQLSWNTATAPLMTMTKAEVALDLSHSGPVTIWDKPEDHLIHATIQLDQPSFFVDVASLQRPSATAATTVTPADIMPSSSSIATTPRTVRLLPFAISLTVDAPSVTFASHDGTLGRGKWEWDQLQLALAGGFIHDTPSTTTESLSQRNTSRPTSPALRIRGELRKQWENLLYRTGRKRRHRAGTGLLYSVEARLTLDGTAVTTQTQEMSQAEPLLLVERIGSTACIRMAPEGSSVSMSDQNRFQYTEANLVVEAPTIKKLCVQRLPEIDFWTRLIRHSSPPSTPAEPTARHYNSWIRLLNVQLTVKKALLEVVSRDIGLRDIRVVPENHVDNSPENDIASRVYCSAEEASLRFNGYPVHHRSGSRDESSRFGSDARKRDPTSADHTVKLGTLQISLEQVAIKQTSWSPHTDTNEPSFENAHTVAWVSRLNSIVTPTALGMVTSLAIRTTVKKWAIAYSLSNHYACILATQTAQALLQHFQRDRRLVPPMDGPRSGVVIQMLQVQLHRTDIRISLPGKTEVYFRMDDLRGHLDRHVDHMKEYPTITVSNLALFGVSPQKEECWSQLFEMDDIDVHMEERQGATLCKVSSNTLCMRIPHGYVFADVIDNSITLVKAIKELHGRLAQPDTYFTFFGPLARGTLILVPNISFSCSTLSIRVEDDPFEVKLRRIFKTAKRASEFLRTDQEKQQEPKQVSQATLQDIRRTKHWIESIKSTIADEESHYQSIRHTEYRHRCAGQQLDTMYDVCNHAEGNSSSRLFTIEVTPLPLYPPLTEIVLSHVALELCDSKMTEQQARLFVHDLGKGMPVDFDFSFLVPFCVALNAGETWIQIRDYPLPLLHVPSVSRSASPNAIAWSLDANYVFADELGSSLGSRRVAVQVAPGYTLDAIRTVSPLKFYSRVDYTIYSKGLSKLCWSSSYQPAFQDISAAFDSLTQSPVDPSPKLGIWDKFRFLVHTRTRFTFKEGEFALVMKGTRDPYQLVGRGAGVMKLWRDHVVWSLGYANPQHEFIQVESGSYVFGVPNLSHTDFQRDSLQDSLDRDPIRFQKRGIKLSNVRMGIRGHLERTCTGECPNCLESQCRISDFCPHYHVLLKSPQNTEQNHDAFRQFRSNFIHLAISIIQQSDDAGGDLQLGAMCISPQFKEHFFIWFALFSDNISYPIRRGTFYRPTDLHHESKKYEPQMTTLKFKIVVEPFAISYFYMDKEDVDNLGRRDHVGLKAHIGSFKVDIHQKRMIKHFYDAKLKQPRMASSWPIQEMEIQLSSVDMRIVTAQATKNAIPTTLDDEWVDEDDYTDLGMDESEPHMISTIDVMPFAFSPCIYFLKQLDRDPVETHSHMEETHDCIMGTAMETHDMQMALLKSQIAKVDQDIKMHSHRLFLLESILTKSANNTDAVFEANELMDANAFLSEKRETLVKCLKDMRRRSTSNLPDVLSVGSSASTSQCKEDHHIFSSKSPSPLCEWEELMGRFRQRCIVHNPQIIWTPSLQAAIIHWRCLRSYDQVQSFNISNRAMQFLLDLTAQQKKRKQAAAPSADIDGHMDSQMAQELIEQLLAATDRTAVSEALDSQEDYATVQPESGSVNDPRYQHQSIPSGYKMKSDTLIDLLNPQVNLHADISNDMAILIASERMQVKMFEIFDTENLDTEGLHELVKKRAIVSTENAQAFVTKRMRGRFDYLQVEHQYGNSGKDCWPLWMPAGMLMNDTFHRDSEQFQRIGSHLAGTIQHDRYNPLRIKTKLSSFSEFQSFEDRCDTVRMNVPQLSLAANSVQYNVVYVILSRLLLSTELPKNQKRRAEWISEFMLTADGNDLIETAKNAIQLHARTQRLALLLKSHRQSDDSMHDLQTIRHEQIDNLEKLHLAIEVIKWVRSRYQPKDSDLEERRSAQTNIKFGFMTQKLDWEMLTDQNTSFSHCTLANIQYEMEGTKDNTFSHTLQVDTLQVKNTSESPVFTEVLSPFIDPRMYRTGPPDFSRQKMLRVYYVSIPPVGGIKVVQHFEINVSPLKAQISHEYGKAVMAYLFPSDTGMDTSATAASLPRANSFTDMSISDCDSLIIADNSLTVDADDKATSGDNESSAWFGKKAMANDDAKRPVSGGRMMAMRGWIRDGITRKSRKPESEDQMSLMKMRASKHRTYIVIKIPGAGHCVSYQGPSDKTIYNLRDFRFQQPDLEYRNKTWSAEELISVLKKDFKVAILKHSPAFLKQKLGMRRRNSVTMVTGDSQPPSPTIEISTVDPETSTVPQETQQPTLELNLSYIATTSQDCIDSSDEDSVDTSDQEDLNEDAISLHSNDSQGSGIVFCGRDKTSTRSQSSKSTSIISRFIPSRKAPTLGTGTTSSITLPKKHQRSISSGSIISSHNTMDEQEELKSKGRLLLGKNYSGPMTKTDAPASPTSSIFRGKQRASSSNSLLSFFSSGGNAL